QTPLHLAAWKGFSDCVRALLKAGAGKDAQKENGQTPLHVAAARGSLECVNALLMAGADKDSEDIFGRSALDVAKKEDVRSLLRYFGRPKPPATKPRAKDISKQKSKSRIPPGAPLPSADQEQPDSF
ncbi:ANKRD53, partial [Symbiodinium pilosum]